MERKTFAVSEEVGTKFSERCRKKGWVIFIVLEKLMRLFNSGVMDSVINSDEDEKKENDTNNQLG